MIRFFDIFFSITGLLLLAPLIVLLSIVGLIDTGKPFFTQTRVGLKEKPFTLIKLRTMRPSTQSVATHLVDAQSVTSYGRFLRTSKLDELPQLWNVLTGDMSLVGPRPCLYNQQALISARRIKNVFEIRPGITGIAQINHIDMSQPEKLAEIDATLVDTLNLRNYFRLIFLTIVGKGSGDKVNY